MQNSQPYQVGITGGIGAGKSTVAKIFSTLGLPVYDADSNAKRIMNQDKKVISKVVGLFGKAAYPDGTLDRKYLAETVFNDTPKLQQLNGIVHPAVALHYEQWLNDHKRFKITIKEAALIFQTKTYQALDKVILVAAPRNLRIQRVLTRDSHRSKSDVEAIINNQMSEEEMRERADYVIENDERQPVIDQVLKLHQALLIEVAR